MNSCMKNNVSPHSIAQDTSDSEMSNMFYATQGRRRSRSPPQCYSCKEIGHIAKYCNKKLCNYCKNEGHNIKDCRICT